MTTTTHKQTLSLTANLGMSSPAGLFAVQIPGPRAVAMEWSGDAPAVVRMEAEAKQDVAYVLIQEGGTSTELYIHAHPSHGEAEDDRVECEENGAYRTSNIIEVPSSLADLPGFYELAEQLVCKVATIRSPFSDGDTAEVDVPESIHMHPAFNEIADQLLEAVSNLSFPSKV